MHDTRLPRQDSNVVSAHLRESQKTLVQAGDHESNFVHVTGNHDSAAVAFATLGSAPQSNQASHCVLADIVTRCFERLSHQRAHLVLVTGYAGCIRERLHQGN